MYNMKREYLHFKLLQRLKRFYRKNNQWLFALFSVYFVYDLLDKIIFKFWPNSTFYTFGSDTLNIPMSGVAYTFIGLTVILLYIRAGFPKGYKTLDEVFQNENKLTSWQRVKAILFILAVLLFVYACSMLAASGTAGLWIQ